MNLLSLEPGSYGHQAARLHDPKAEISFCKGNLDIISRTQNGEGLGVLPIENSTEGLVMEVIKGFWLKDAKEKPIYVTGELQIPINHCLMGIPGTDLSSVTQVISHPQSLGQCAGTLKALGIEVRNPAISNPRAAKQVSEGKDPTVVAIAPAIAAELFGLEILQVGIQDFKENATRFHLISTTPAKMTGCDRTALVCHLPNRPRSLADAIDIIGDLGSSLSTIHSIPLGRPGCYASYMELDGHRDCVIGKQIIARIAEVTGGKFRILGSYPRSVVN